MQSVFYLIQCCYCNPVIKPITFKGAFVSQETVTSVTFIHVAPPLLLHVILTLITTTTRKIICYFTA